MQQRLLGSSGLRISRLGLGTMTWGRSTDQHEAAAQLTAFLEAGGTLVDTAAGYADGDAERVVGIVLSQVLGRRWGRGDVVLASKAGVSRRTGERAVDVSRRALLDELDASLERLGTDHLDLWQIHGWSDEVPLAETLSAAADAIASGRVRYVGISNYSAWQTSWAACAFAALRPGTGLVSTQMEYSLLNRDVEADVLPAAAALGLGLLPYSPLARGVLTGKYRHGTPADSRAAAGELDSERHLTPFGRGIVDAVSRAADGLDLTPSAVALAWVRDRPGVGAPIVGARTAAQLQESLKVEQVELPDEISEVLSEVSDPNGVR
jgi:aryl-alcohol dehydrogenase-like predicted oxidoreductase